MEHKRVFMVMMFLTLLMLPTFLTFMSNRDVMVEPSNIENPIRDFMIAASPTVDTTNSQVTNLDDTDNLYGGGYKTYILVANCSDTDGGTTITKITVAFGSYFSFEWLNTSIVTELTGASKVRLGTYSNVTAGNDVDLTINFKVEWAMMMLMI